MASRIRVKIVSMDKGAYLEKHRDIISKSMNQIIEVSEWDYMYWVAALRTGSLLMGFSPPIPVLICKDDCIKL